jgi:hypothetical protein
MRVRLLALLVLSTVSSVAHAQWTTCLQAGVPSSGLQIDRTVGNGSAGGLVGQARLLPSLLCRHLHRELPLQLASVSYLGEWLGSSFVGASERPLVRVPIRATGATPEPLPLHHNPLQPWLRIIAQHAIVKDGDAKPALWTCSRFSTARPR